MDLNNYISMRTGVEEVILSLRVSKKTVNGLGFEPAPPLHCATAERRWQNKHFRVAVISCNGSGLSSGGEDLFISVSYLAPISGGGWSWGRGAEQGGNTPVELFIAAPVIRITPRRLGLS